MAKRSVLLLCGGKTGEHEVSLMSAASIIRNLDPRANDCSLVGINREGRWFLQPETVLSDVRRGGEVQLAELSELEVSVRPGLGLFSGGKPLDFDVVFPVLHGSFGEDGTVQGLLELVGLPYVGSGVLGSSLGMDKEAVKRVWRQAELPIVPFVNIELGELLSDEKEVGRLYDQCVSEFGNVLFVKPARAGSSVGISRVGSAQEFASALGSASRFDFKILVEPAVRGREIECSVLAAPDGVPKARGVGEVIPSHDFYDYDAKYVDPEGARLVIPADVDPAVYREAQHISERAFKACEAAGMARVDFLLDTTSGELLLNEINTIPGFTKISMFPMLCAEDGIAYAELIERLLELAETRHERHSRLSYQWS